MIFEHSQRDIPLLQDCTMSIIRNLLYNGTSFDALQSGILYNKNLLHNFILQHQPRFIIHCGSPENALDLAYFIRENHSCEILHIKNWNPNITHWLQTTGTGEAPNPHKVFLDKINEHKLDDYLVSFNGLSETASEILNQRNVRFNMMISDNIGEAMDYIPLLKLLQKNALHIRYIGDKKISDIKNEAIFQMDIETSFTYAQGYFITGMDYLSLYEGQATQSSQQHSTYQDDTISNSNTHNFSDLQIHTHAQAMIHKHHLDNSEDELIWTGSEFAVSQEVPIAHDNTQQQAKLSPQEERQEQVQDQADTINEHHQTHYVDKNQQTISELLPYKIDDNGTNTISAARRALRERRAARQLKALNNN
jgi:hypothetical protein